MIPRPFIGIRVTIVTYSLGRAWASLFDLSVTELGISGTIYKIPWNYL